jgi:hypothetical protein
VNVNQPGSMRPTVQMYDGTDFVDRLLADPGASLKFGEDDRWSYPVAVTPGIGDRGRSRFATSRLVHTDLRKLYQPSHSRFYAVVVEVFCDEPGLPRAGSHDDIEVFFVMRRQRLEIAADAGEVRQLARGVLRQLAKQPIGTTHHDVANVWWADVAALAEFNENHAELLGTLNPIIREEGWGRRGDERPAWRNVSSTSAGDPELLENEERIPMWRLPPAENSCDAASTRSLWFGLIPTYSSDHWTDTKGQIQTKLDDDAIYQLRCVVVGAPPPGHEQCPSSLTMSAPTVPFRLASAYDPDGTKNRTISVTGPDLRRLAARASKKQGPGGLRITTPPGSSLSPIDSSKFRTPGAGSLGPGGSICTFAFELFFIVALFLFLLFLPIIMIVFQLWWMLALRFCIPPSLSFRVLTEFFVSGGLNGAPGTLGNLSQVHKALLDDIVGMEDAGKVLSTVSAGGTFNGDPLAMVDLLAAMDAADAILVPVPPDLLVTPADPLCVV